VRHLCGEKCASADDRESCHGDTAQTKSQLQCSGERTHQTEQQNIDAHGGANGAATPSEFVVQWVHQHAGR
jgi:hypothetical protein